MAACRSATAVTTLSNTFACTPSSACSSSNRAPHVRVRVVSQRLGDGRLYLKKGVIVDVTTPRECTLQLDDGGALVDGVPQHSLETVLPKKAAGRLLVVSGKLRGSRATLVSQDGGQGTAHVRLAADLPVVTLPLDALAEYTGPMDEHD